MTLVLGRFHHADGTYDLALAETDQDNPSGNLKTVVSFPESSGEKEVNHDVPRGTGDGEFSG